MNQEPRNRRSSRHRKYRRRRILVMLLAAALFIFGLVKLIGYFADLSAARRASDQLRQVYASASTDTPVPATEEPILATEEPALPAETPTPAPTKALPFTRAPSNSVASGPKPTQTPILRLPSKKYPGNPSLQVTSQFKALQKENKDIMGWLTIGKQLDEPVVQRDNFFYLNHNAYGKENVNGALFLDSSISLKTWPYSYVIYGHNMKTGAMFGSLRNYENITYYHNDPFISFNTMYESGRYVVFSVGNISTEEDTMNYVDFFALMSANTLEREQAIKAMIDASVYTCAVDVQPEDQLLVLVTCVEKDEERRIVAARRVRDGEKEADLKTQVAKSRKIY